MMNPTKYCDAIKCVDCKYYQDCLSSEINTKELKGILLPKIKMVKILVNDNGKE